MKIDSFDTCPIIKNSFYLHYTMNLYLLTECNEGNCTFIDFTNLKMEGKIDVIKAIYDVTEEQLPTVNVITPLEKGNYQLLWYKTNIRKKKNMLLKPLQVWISEPNDELFVVHPDQNGLPNNKIRILAADYHITKPKFLYYDVNV